MFRNLDKSPFNDSTGLKFIDYLTKKVDGAKPHLRSRKQLFQLQSRDATVDEFSIHKITEKENTLLAVPRPSSPPAKKITAPGRSPSSTLGRSSVFKPNFMSTPMVPTTVNTPYRASKKSIGIQNSPLVEVPLSQEPEIPETPEVVMPPPPQSKESLPIPPVVDESLPPPPPEFLEPERIYPDLQNIERQQEVLPPTPVVVPVPREVPKTPITTAVVEKNNNAVGQIPLPKPPPQLPTPPLPPPPSPPRTEGEPIQPTPATPTAAKAKRTTVLLEPEEIMAIIHGSPSRAAAPREEEAVQEALPSPVANPDIRNVRTQRILMEQMPETPATAPLPEREEEAATQMSNRRVQYLDNSSFLVPPTPELRNFKIHITDCIAASNSTEQDFQRLPLPPRSTRATKTKAKRVARASELTIPKEDQRSSIVIPSTQKRRLHSTIRELTPISSPLAVQHSPPETNIVQVESAVMREFERQPTASVVAKRSRARRPKPVESVQPPPRNIETPGSSGGTKETRSVAKKASVRGSSATRAKASDRGAEKEKKEKPKEISTTRRPGPKSKTGPRPSEVEEMLNDWESPPAEEALVREGDTVPPPPPPIQETMPPDDAALFKVPELPVPKKKSKASQKRNKSPVEPVSNSLCETTDQQNTRRSHRPVKPTGKILPYYMLGLQHHTGAVTINYKDDLSNWHRDVQTVVRVSEKARTKKKSPPQAQKEVGNNKDAGEGTSKDTGNEKKRPRTTSKPAIKKQKRVSNDEAFDTLKEISPAREVASVMPAIPEDTEFVPESVAEVAPATRSRSKRIEKPKSRNFSSSTYRDNFSANLGPASSTGVDWSHCTSMARKTKTLDMATVADITEERVRHQEFNGGKMMAYQDYSKGIIVLHSKKERARVKRKPLVLNMGYGTVLVNLESEQRVVRMEELDELSIPVNMWYSIENIGDNAAVLMFTWT